MIQFHKEPFWFTRGYSTMLKTILSNKGRLPMPGSNKELERCELGKAVRLLSTSLSIFRYESYLIICIDIKYRLSRRSIGELWDVYFTHPKSQIQKTLTTYICSETFVPLTYVRLLNTDIYEKSRKSTC